MARPTVLWQNIRVSSAFPDPGIILRSTVNFGYKQLPGSPLGQVGVTSSQWGTVLPGLPTHNLSKHTGPVVRPEASEHITQGSSHTRNGFHPPPPRFH